MGQTFFRYLFCFNLLWGGMLGQMMAQSTGLHWDASTYNFGDVLRGQSTSHTYRIDNQGDQPIQIQGVKTGCGCLSAEWSTKPIEPGQAGFVKLTFHSRDKLGYQHRQANVIIQGQQDPIVLTLDGRVLMEDGLPAIDSDADEVVVAPTQQRIEQDGQSETGIQFETLSHDFGMLQAGQSQTFAFVFYNYGSTPYRITDLKRSSANLEADVKSTAIAPGASGTIQVKLTGGTQTGHMQETLEVVFENATQPPIVLKLGAEVE